MSWLGATLIILGAVALLHGLVRHLWPSLNTVGTFCFIAGLAGASLLLRLAMAFGPGSMQLLAAACLYAFLCELYLFALTFVIGSVSVSLLLVHLDLQHASPADSPQSGDYPAMTNQRLERMTQVGLLYCQAGRYRLTRRGRMLLRGFRRCRDFFGHSSFT
jgi:hypothetical protein